MKGSRSSNFSQTYYHILRRSFFNSSFRFLFSYSFVHRFHDQELEDKLKYVSKWVLSHIEDGDEVLKKPVTFTEFGYSNLNKDFQPSHRDRFYKVIFDAMYESAQKRGSGGGSFVWQFLVGGMEEYNDDFGIVPWERSATYRIITEHSCRLALSEGGFVKLRGSLKDLCFRRR